MSLRFAILHHTGIAEPHFDLLFETHPGSDLAAWRISAWPIEDPTAAIRIKDHRRAYLDYEGEVSRHRGYVERVAGGTCEVKIGEGSEWTIRLLADAPAMTFTLRPVGERWEITPI